MQPDHRFLGCQTQTSTPVEAAIVIAGPDACHWERTCDVLVVGLGLAGVSAALRTAEDETLDLIAIDRGEGGGASRLSGGVVYMGGGTRAQREAGVNDTPEAMADYLAYETGGIVREDTLRRFAAATTGFQDWLEKYGARFGGPATNDKTSYPNNASLYYSGNELTVPGRERAKPAQRGHRAKPSRGGEPRKLSGHYLLPPLIASLGRMKNATVLRQSRATRLVVDGDGAVLGAEIKHIPPGFAAWKHARLLAMSNNLSMSVLGLTGILQRAVARLEAQRSVTLRIRAKRGVVLAAGGFAFNRLMMEAAAPDYLASVPLGTIGDDGSGIKLGMTVGAKTGHLDRVSAWRFLYPPASWVMSCSVGPDGERLVGEEYYGARTGEAVFGKGDGKGWLIMDEPLHRIAAEEIRNLRKLMFQKVQYRAIQKSYTVTAATLEELAAKIGVPAQRMAATLASYNGHISRGEPDPLGKSEKYRRTIVQGPFHALDIGAAPAFWPIPALTMGGLVTDEDTGAVLSLDGGPVQGLYAAGRTAVGICSHYYVSGLSLADCIWSGMRAADSLRHLNVNFRASSMMLPANISD